MATASEEIATLKSLPTEGKKCDDLRLQRRGYCGNVVVNAREQEAWQLTCRHQEAQKSFNLKKKKKRFFYHFTNVASVNLHV